MADEVWREPKDERPRTFEDVKDAPYAWPGEKVFAATEAENRAYSDEHRTPMSERERDEFQRHRFVTGALRRTICAPQRRTMVLGIEKTITERCPGTCRECQRGKTIPNMVRSSWNDEWHASQHYEARRRQHHADAAMTALGKVNEALNLYGYTLVCADVLRDLVSRTPITCNGSNCRAFVAIPIKELKRARDDGFWVRGPLV